MTKRTLRPVDEMTRTVQAIREDGDLSRRITPGLLPLIVIVTAVLGYFMTKRTLRPVDEMTRTVQAIREDGDLSRRITPGNGNDEICRLAATFDSMLTQIEESLMRERQFASDAAHELRTPLSTMTGNGNDEICRLAATFDSMLTQIEESLMRERQFASDAAHELRTPLSTMTLLCDTLLLDDTLNKSARKDILLLQKKVAGLSHMISQLLMLSRADRGQATISQERLNLSELAILACEEVQDAASSKNISIHTDIEPNLFLTGDETLLIRFFLNLLNNAVSYGNQNGHICVTLKKSAAGDGRINGSIQDDGIGISTSDLPHIWERFFQADSSRTKSDNSGLGLSMVAWIIKEHRGEITVNSLLNEGTTFTFFFPQADSSRTKSDNSGLGLSMVAWIIKEHRGEITVNSLLNEGTTFTFFFPAE